MLLAKVIGTVVATRKDPELEGLKLLLVRPLTVGEAAAAGLSPAGAPIVAVDAVGAGIGEVVLYAAGSSARQTRETKDRPVDHVIMAVVDQVELSGALAYDKAHEG